MPGVGLVRKRTDAAEPPETLVQYEALLFALAWINQGETLVYTQIQSQGEGAVFTVELGQEPRQLSWVGPGGRASITNNEQWIALCDWPDDGIFVGRFPNIASVFAGPATGCTPRWGDDDKRLYYQSFDKLWAVDVDIGKVVTFGKREEIADLGTPDPFPHFDVDGRGRIVIARHGWAAPKPVLVMNWERMLE